MKKLVVSALVATLLALPARAVIVGASVGYLTDSKEAYYTARVGAEFANADRVSHLGELEVGYTEKKESIPLTVGALSGRMRVKGDITPLMLNYRAEIAGNDIFGGYAGAGLGTAHVSVSGSGLGVSVSDSDNAFAWQAFVGLTYKPTTATSIHVGVRYIRINDVTIQGVRAEIGDDTALEAGISFKF